MKSDEKVSEYMTEHQTIEWEKSWHDDYLEWICGYANAYGGTLYIGKDNDGKVVRLSDKDVKKLLENIPNKITDTMGIVDKYPAENFTNNIERMLLLGYTIS